MICCDYKEKVIPNKDSNLYFDVYVSEKTKKILKEAEQMLGRNLISSEVCQEQGVIEAQHHMLQ